ncbi:MAG: hypothetical protein ACOYBD_08705 [Bilifractor sp.]|jgi:SAM-dependent methyltransferase
MKEPIGRTQLGNKTEKTAAASDEKELLKILKDCPEGQYRCALKGRRNEFLLEELSGLRGNLVRAFEVPEGTSALEIGGGYGSLTCVLAEKCERVVSWDCDADRIKINAFRNRDRQNVMLYSGNFRDFCGKTLPALPEHRDGFGLIVCIGPMQAASGIVSGDAPCRELVRELLSFLAQDGFLLILLKGIREYRQLSAGGLLSGYRSELYEISPDEKFPMEIAGEEWLSERHFGGGFCSEDEGNRPCLLLIRGKRRAADTLLYAKFSGERTGRYALYTAVYEKCIGDEPQRAEMRTAGRRYVEKTALAEAAASHVGRICDLCGKLSEMYGDSLQINRCEKTVKPGTVRMEYLTGETYEEYLDRILAEQGPEACGRALLEYLDLVVPKDLETTFEMTDSFREIFGELPGDCGSLFLKTLPVSDVDLIPANVIRGGGSSTLIDYEWTFTFPVPSDFLRYRILFYYLRSGKSRERLADVGIYERAGLDGQKRKAFASMEDSFQRWLTKDSIPVRDLREEASEGSAETESVDRSLRVYFPAENGAEAFSELRAADYAMKKGRISTDLEIPRGMKMIRLDPGDRPGILQIRRLAIDGRSPVLIRTNGIPVFSESEDGNAAAGPVPSGRPVRLSAIYFCKEDPNFTIGWDESETSAAEHCHKVTIDFRFTEVDGAFLEPLMDLQKQQEGAPAKHHRKGGFLHRLAGREK